jgi:hypothetical protein
MILESRQVEPRRKLNTRQPIGTQPGPIFVAAIVRCSDHSSGIWLELLARLVVQRVVPRS